jgi:uncharacterized protein (DUF1800 family)
MPALNEENVRHLLRRTECVDRPQRVRHLLSLGSIDAAVADVMAIPERPLLVSIDGLFPRYFQGIRLTEHWLDQMAFSARPFGERMAFFWHGHICTDMNKAKFGRAMNEQINLFRTAGLGPSDSASGNVGSLMVTMATQVAMLCYLDNDRNLASSPNQNFARELMELFVLGVGNYTEADVEAATAAWTGHNRPGLEVDAYAFDPSEHNGSPQTFLGKVVNSGTRPLREAGQETIEVMLGTGPLGSGTVPLDAATNAGRPTREVAAEFLTLKLWREFGEAASGSIPAGVGDSMKAALLASDFNIRPWVRAMLTHHDFYAPSTKAGLVRQPVDYVVALLAATQVSANRANLLDAMRNAGQRPLYPPNVSGWRPNLYWVNASAIGARQQIAQQVIAFLTDSTTTWALPNGFISLLGGQLSRAWFEDPARSSTEVVDELIRLTGLVDLAGRTGTPAAPLSADTRLKVIAHLDNPNVEPTMRLDALALLLSAPEMHVA